MIRATRLAVVWPTSYFLYSRTTARVPSTAIVKKTVPVTSSHNWCMARLKDRVVAQTPLITALNVRLRRTCCPATRVATPAVTPKVRGIEPLPTASILTGRQG
jgi:hypothetical protein